MLRMAPILYNQYSKKHQDDFRQRWCDKPMNGHRLEWNRKLGVHRFHEDEGLVHCKFCKQSWPTVNIAKNPGKETLQCRKNFVARAAFSELNMISTVQM